MTDCKSYPKPTIITCPVCGSDDVSKVFRGKGDKFADDRPTGLSQIVQFESDYDCEFIIDMVSLRARRPCFQSRCRSCGWKWAAPMKQRACHPRPEPVHAEKRPTVVTVCGSSRFIEQMAVVRWELEKAGKITLGLHLLPMAYAQCQDHMAEEQDVAAAMDELHLRKIDMSDHIFVVNVDGYIGESTAREIAYAKKKGIPVVYLEDHNESGGRHG